MLITVTAETDADEAETAKTGDYIMREVYDQEAVYLQCKKGTGKGR